MPNKKTPTEIIKKIRLEVLSGKTKYQVAKEMNLEYKLVYTHTADLPSYKIGEPHIRGKTLDLLKQMLKDGFVYSNQKTHYHLRRLKKFFPMVQRAQMDGKSVYYLNDKNKIALQAMIKDSRARVLSYQDLAKMSRIFDINLSNDEKSRFLGKTRPSNRRKRRKSKKSLRTVSKENQSVIDDFFGRFLHSDVLFCDNILFIVKYVY